MSVGCASDDVVNTEPKAVHNNTIMVAAFDDAAYVENMVKILTLAVKFVGKSLSR